LVIYETVGNAAAALRQRASARARARESGAGRVG